MITRTTAWGSITYLGGARHLRRLALEEARAMLRHEWGSLAKLNAEMRLTGQAIYSNFRALVREVEKGFSCVS